MAAIFTPCYLPYWKRTQTSDNAGTNWSLGSAVNQNFWLWDDQINRVSRPDWRDKLQKGQDASNYYFRSGTSYVGSPAYGYAWTPAANIRENGYIGWYGMIPARQPSDNALSDLALARVKRKIASLEDSYQALIPLAELREARGLFRQMVDYTLDMVKAVAELKRTKGKSLFRFAQDRWLIYSFGISPMMADLKGLGESMWAFLTKGDVRDRVTGSAGRNWVTSSSDQTGSITGLYGAPLVAASEAQHVLKYRYIAGWKFLIRSSNDYSALRHFGVTPAAIIPALWETLAYSWVVDYFTTAGDWLEDVFVGSAGSSMYVVQNRSYKYTSIGTFVCRPWPGTTMLGVNRHGVVRLEHFQFERTPLGALPPRLLRFKSVDEVGKHALTKLLNLASLTFRGKRWTDV